MRPGMRHAPPSLLTGPRPQRQRGASDGKPISPWPADRAFTSALPAGRTAATSGGEAEYGAVTVLGVADGDQVLVLADFDALATVSTGVA